MSSTAKRTRRGDEESLAISNQGVIFDPTEAPSRALTRYKIAVGGLRDAETLADAPPGRVWSSHRGLQFREVFLAEGTWPPASSGKTGLGFA